MTSWRALAVALALALAAWPAAATAAVRERATLSEIEPQVMCVVCGIPLNVAQSDQATDERDLISQLIDKGDTVSEIKTALIAQYGQRVIAEPPGSGFGLVAYLVPIALALLVAGSIAVLLPRWRRRGAARVAAATCDGGAATISAADAARLDAELHAFDA